MSVGSRRLVAAVVAAGAVSLSISTGVAGAEPDASGKPVLATTCGDTVQGTAGQPVALSSTAVKTAVAEAGNAAAPGGLVGQLVDGLTGKTIALPQKSFPVGEVTEQELPIEQPAVVDAIMVALEPTFAEHTEQQEPAEGEQLRAEFRQALDETVPADCAISVQLKVPPKPETPKPETPGKPDTPPKDQPGNPPAKPGVPGDGDDNDNGSPAAPKTPAKPPAASPPVQATAPPPAPDAPSLPPALSPRAPIGAAAPPLFDSPLFDGKGVPGVPSGQSAPDTRAVAPVGNATTLAEPSTSDDRDSLGFGMLAGVLAASAVTAGLVRAAAARRGSY